MIDRLIAAGVNPTQARAFAEPLKAAMALYDISTDERRAAFLAHCMIESQGFTKMEENMFYTDPARVARIFKTGFDLDRDGVVDPEEIEFAKGYVRNPKALANRAYANRNGNGNEASGDGWNFRGRGFGITGRANYAAASLGVGLGSVYLQKPELVAQPTDACLSFAWYWLSRGCNQAIDSGNFDTTTRLVNGPGMLHKHERSAAFHRNLTAFA